MPGLADGDSDGTHDEKINFWTGLKARNYSVWYPVQTTSDVKQVDAPLADMDENSDH